MTPILQQNGTIMLLGTPPRLLHRVLGAPHVSPDGSGCPGHIYRGRQPCPTWGGPPMTGTWFPWHSRNSYIV